MDNTIAQNLVIQYPCQAPVLKTPANATIATQSDPAVAPPSTTSLVDSPNTILQEALIGAQTYG